MELHEIVMKLTGEIYPLGDSGVDERRLENLDTLPNLLDRLLGKVHRVSLSKDNHQASVAAIGKAADSYLESLSEWTPDPQ